MPGAPPAGIAGSGAGLSAMTHSVVRNIPAIDALLSGHTDGSRAFARYREIDMDMKRELVEMID